MIVLFATWSFGLASPCWRTWFNVAVIVVGVMMTAFGELQFAVAGFVFQLTGRFFESFRLAMVEVLLSDSSTKMNPLVSLYYFAPVCALMIGLVAAVAELPRITIEDIERAGLGLLVASAAVAFLLNAAGVLLVSETIATIAHQNRFANIGREDRTHVSLDAAAEWRAQDHSLDLCVSHLLGHYCNCIAACRKRNRPRWTALLFARGSGHPQGVGNTDFAATVVK